MTPNCSTCGYVVEWVRKSYKSHWRLFSSCPDRLTPGQYAFAPEGTPHYPAFHNLGALVWTSDEARTSETLGEVPGGYFGYHNGAAPRPYPSAVRVGSAACVEHGEDVNCIDKPVLSSENGASWSYEDNTYRIDFQDSWICSGTNFDRQRGEASVSVYFTEAHDLTVTLTGRTERQSKDFDVGKVLLDGQEILRISGTQELLGCEMGDHTATTTLRLAQGEYKFLFSGDTLDANYHVGMFFEFALTVEPPIPENENSFDQGFDARCFQPLPVVPPPPAFLVDIFDRMQQIAFAEALALTYTDMAAAQARLDALIGTPSRTFRRSNDASLLPGLCFAEYAACNVVMISGTNNETQLALECLGAAGGPHNYASYGTNAFWFGAKQIVARLIGAFAFNVAKPFVFIGHSYGGALCTLTVADYLAVDPERDIELFTLGMPRPGDRRLNELLRFARSCHYARDDDPIPGLPPTGQELASIFGAIPRAFLARWALWVSPPGERVLHANGGFDEGLPVAPGYSLLLEIALAAVAGDPFGPFAGHEASAYVSWLSNGPPL